ncbi:hypothetical protein [Streptomyces sp. NPDC001315]|uniref:hypothetical protein n=1 Tax=Streptomyces sp. NPDC001315 TaxID=3364562 RepID=UPI0036798E33
MSAPKSPDWRSATSRATADDIRAWAEATGQPEADGELLTRLRGLESHIRSWRRQLAAGHKAVQDAHNEAQARAAVLHAWESSWIVGVLTAAFLGELQQGAEELGIEPVVQDFPRPSSRWAPPSGT